MMATGNANNELIDEFKKLVIKMTPPRVTVDNNIDTTATRVKVDTVNKYGTLVDVLQVLSDLKLTIKKAYIFSDDGEWFMDVFHVVDEDGNKIVDSQAIERIEETLGAGPLSFRAPDGTVGVEAEAEAEAAQTAIELVGRDRPGLLSEVFDVLTNLKCNIVASEVWTHDGRMAALVHVTDSENLGAIGDPERLDTAKRLLRHVLCGSSRDRDRDTRAAISPRVDTYGQPRLRLRLLQIMRADRSSGGGDGGGRSMPVVAVEDCAECGYTQVYVGCRDRPKLLFDIVCTLTDMEYVVFDGVVIVDGSKAYQGYYIRHKRVVSSDQVRQRLALCLEAVIQQRRNTQGLRLALCCEDRVGLLSDVTRIFREHGLAVTHAEVVPTTAVARTANVFYVVDASGEPVQAQAVAAVRADIGEQLLFVRELATGGPKSPTGRDGRRSLGNMIRSRSERLLYNLGLFTS